MDLGRPAGKGQFSTNVISTIKMNVIKDPHRTALICEGREESWGELWKRTNQLANALLTMGLKKPDRILIYMPNCFEYPEIILAAEKAGLVAVFANFRLGPEELYYQIESSGASAVFVKSEQYAVLNSVRDRLPNLNAVVMAGAEQVPQGVLDYETLLSGGSDDEPDAEVLPDDIHVFLYTSGTTGKPKAAVRTRRNEYHMCVSQCLEFGLNENSIQLVVAPISAAAQVGHVFGTFFSGSTMVILPAFVPEEVLKAIDKYKSTWMFMVPIMYEWMLSLPPENLAKYDMSSLKKVLACGAPLHTPTLQKMVEYFEFAEVFNVLGCSEFAFVSKISHKEWLEQGKEGSIGKALLDLEFKVVDQDGKECGPNDPGILYVRGPLVFEGYWNNIKGTRESFLNCEWATVGDVARRDEDGYYYLVDRAKDMIITGGTNVYPVEIEGVILTMDSVADVAVIGVPDEKWGEAVKAIVVLKPGAAASEQDIQDFCRGSLAGFKIPKSVDFVEQIPRSPIGKTLKRELREKYWEGHDVAIS